MILCINFYILPNMDILMLYLFIYFETQSAMKNFTMLRCVIFVYVAFVNNAKMYNIC